MYGDGGAAYNRPIFRNTGLTLFTAFSTKICKEKKKIAISLSLNVNRFRDNMG